MITLASDQINVWIAAFIWPLARVSGLVMTAPVFSSQSIPAMVKVGLVVAFTLIITPLTPVMPAVDPTSPVGLLILAQQWIIGLAFGFVFQIALAALEMAGMAISMASGLGFAAFFDFETHAQTDVIRQLLVLLTTVVFLSLNGHLDLIAALVDSFSTLPVSADPVDKSSLWRLALWGGTIFSAGLQIALPVITAILLTNLALGILTRAAPQLNLFNIGFTLTLGVAFVALAITIPYLLQPIEHLFEECTETLNRISKR